APMRATVMHEIHDVRIENMPDAAIQEPGDAIIRITRACICGSDLWPYNDGPTPGGQRMGHEAIGVVEEVGSGVRTIKRGQVVIMPFVNSDGTCMFCEEGLPAACVHRNFFGNGTGLDGAQAEALRIPFADGTLYPLNVGERGEEGVARVRELTSGVGVHSVLECVGTDQALATCMGIVRPGGAVGRVGVPHYETIPGARQMFYDNVSVGGGPAPTRAYID